MNKKFLVATALVTQLAAGTAYACGDDTEMKWKSPDAATPPISMQDAKETLQAKGLIVEKSDLQLRCGPAFYTVRADGDEEIIGTFPVPDEKDGRYIILRAEQVVGDSTMEAKQRATRLNQAHKDFRDDVDALDAEYGVTMYAPNALSLAARFPENGNKQRVYVMTELCETVKTPQGDRSHYSSSTPLLPDGALLNTFEFVPGRSDYSEKSLYHKGDAKRELLSNPELRKALNERVEQNALGCYNHRYSVLGKEWALIENRLGTESVEQLMQSAYARYNQKFNTPADADHARIIQSAVLNNGNTISITYKKDDTNLVLRIAGDADDILRIEQDMARKGIETDRTSGLDSMGRAEVKYNQLKAPLPVAP